MGNNYLVVWFLLTPSLDEFKEINLYTLGYIFLRNSMIVFIYAGFFHLHFYIKKNKKIILNIMQSS